MAGVKEYAVGDVITSKKGAKATVVEVHEDHLVIRRGDGVEHKLFLRTETPEEKRRRENIEAGRHPLFISLEDAPPNAATVLNRMI